MADFKLIALDLDGTLNNTYKTITPDTKKALLRAQEQGIKIVLASGRSMPGLLEEARELELERYQGHLISYNGAMVYSMSDHSTLLSRPIPRELSSRLLKIISPYSVTPIVDDGIHLYTDQPEDPYVKYELANNHLALKVIASIPDTITFSPHKILLDGDQQILCRVKKEVAGHFQGTLDFNFSAPDNLEITLPGVSKGSSLQFLADTLAIPAGKIIAFGDGDSDVSMFQYAGLGVAMANASAAAKAAATMLTRSNDEDGIAHALAKLL